MRIALTADPELPVPPATYGGIERIVDMLARGLCSRGHDVLLFANPASRTAGKLAAWPGSSSRSILHTAQNAALLSRHARVGAIDIVHSFSRIAYLTPILPRRLPKIMSFQREITPKTVRLGVALASGSLTFTACGSSLVARASPPGRWEVIPNGVPLDGFDFVATVADDAPLVFLGRIEPIKGTHLAIEAAQAAGASLVIAGNVEPQHRDYFDTRIRPHLGDRIRFVGPVNDKEKNALLGAARAMLMPITWEEPFGIVMTEAMACGTPVIGFDRGAVREVVVHHESGFVCETLTDMIAAIGKISQIDRHRCRSHVEAHFSQDAVVSQYEALYRSRIDELKDGAAAHDV